MLVVSIMSHNQLDLIFSQLVRFFSSCCCFGCLAVLDGTHPRMEFASEEPKVRPLRVQSATHSERERVRRLLFYKRIVLIDLLAVMSSLRRMYSQTGPRAILFWPKPKEKSNWINVGLVIYTRLLSPSSPPK